MIGKMRRLFNIYILVLLALGAACQRVDLPEVNQPAELPTGAVGSKATITFSTADVTGPETRGIVNAQVEIETLHLIVFDENGMLVEVCKAKEHGSNDQGSKLYSVILTVTDKPRIIHYVANCPVDQVVYGHETSIIGNMFVDRNHSEGAQTEYEVSYWARIEVPHILVVEEEVTVDGEKKKVLSLAEDIKDKFMDVPLLRNYAEITVTDDVENKDNTFKVEGFIVYNLLNRGTVAPYNSNTQEFQSFFKRDGKNITNYLYPEMYNKFHYEGHALTSATLITDLVRNPDGTIKEFKPNEPFYVYERKVSVMTDEEEKWRESPPHIIIKARYNNGNELDTTKLKDYPIYYYKMDLVYTEKDTLLGTEEVKYYNILRNFKYDFNITRIHDVGYGSWEEAAAGAAGNNISGSSTTSKLTNISDTEGRLWVSYTDITLVTGDTVTFRYKYIPNYYDSTKADTYLEVDNSEVRFENKVGEVITGIEVAKNDATDGWREVTIHVNQPSHIARQQILYLKTDNSNLNRQIRHTLRQKLTMQVECPPKVPGKILEKMQVDIKLPLGMTEDMFPLALNMETYDRTLSPDATKNTIPVTAGTSIIDTDDRKGQLSYYYTVTIPTFDAYRAMGDNKVVSTYWLTNKADNASTFYVANKYFNLASDSWENYQYEFSNAKCSSPAVGVDQNVTISFDMDSGDNAYNSRSVKISLEGMTYNGATEVTYKPTKQSRISLTCKTTTETGNVSFTLDAENYNIFGPVEGERQTYKFGGKFVDAKSLEVVTSLAAEADVEVDFTFNIPADALAALKEKYPGDAGVPMYITLNRMHPADDQLVYSQVRAEGDRYIYRIKQAGTQTIRLATTEDTGGPCTVTLQADYFDDETVEIQQVGREFNSLIITNKRIAQGLGRSVNITFELATEEGDNAQKDVTVTLVNMAINGNKIVTFNTGDSNAVTNNNGTYTIKNVVTAGDPAGELKVMITAKGYSSREATFKERPMPKFTASLDKTRLGANAGEDVELRFSSEDLVDGMAVTLELDGLKPQADQPTRAATSYVYTVNGTGTQTITLLTTESTATSKTCSVQLKADYFETETITIDQTAYVEVTGKISFADATQRDSYTNSQQVWTNAGVTLTNEKSSSYTNVSNRTNPVRFYNGQKLTIGAEGNIKSITFVCNNSTYATNLQNSIGTGSGATVTRSGSNVTVTFTNATATQFVIDLTGNVRMNSLTVTYMSNNLSRP